MKKHLQTHYKKYFAILLILFAILAIINSVQSSPKTGRTTAPQCTLYVDNGYTSAYSEFGVSKFNTIQSAIDKATAGCTIFVSPGIYYENVAIGKHNITLEGAGFEKTTIDGRNYANTVSISSSSNSTISGFTITGASGSAIYISNGDSTTIRNCRLTKNNGGTGVAVYFDSASSHSRISYCIIDHNRAWDATFQSISHIISIFNSNSILIASNTFVNNTGAPIIGALNVETKQSSTGTSRKQSERDAIGIKNNIMWDNYPGSVKGLSSPKYSLYVIRYNDFQDNYLCGVDGNICLNPLFVDQNNSDYHLSPNSPAIDAGDPSDKAPAGGGHKIDMGALEYIK